MGVFNTKWKKWLLQMLFGKYYYFIKSDKSFAQLIKVINDKSVVIIDINLSIESAIDKCTKELAKKNDKLRSIKGSYFFEEMSKTIEPYLDTGVDTILTMDKLPRVEIKDVDIKRYYPPDAKLFSAVNDNHFPILYDYREKEIKSIKKEINTVLTAIKNLKKANKKTMKIDNDDEEEEKIKCDDIDKKIVEKEIKSCDENNNNYSDIWNQMPKTHQMSEKEVKRIINKCIERKVIICNHWRDIEKMMEKIQKIKSEIEKDPIDVWSDGKGNMKNRLSVYRYITEKIREMGKSRIREGAVFVLDGAILNNDIFLEIDLKRINGIVSEKANYGSQLGEGEQGIMYYILDYISKGYTRFIVHSYDTDLVTYCCINFNYFKSLGLKSLWLRVRNFKYKAYFHKSATIETLSELYYIDINKVVEEITTKYNKKNFNNPLWDPVFTFFYVWGIFLGNDFIRGVHEIILEFFKEKDKKADECTKKFLEIMFVESERYKMPLIELYVFVTKGITNINMFRNNQYFYTTVNMELLMKILLAYREEANLLRFTAGERKKLIIAMINSEYVTNYFINHFRIIDPMKRKFLIPQCDRKVDGYSVYGYEKSEEGKIIQSMNISPKYNNIIFEDENYPKEKKEKKEK